jgi:hypothetical protein
MQPAKELLLPDYGTVAPQYAPPTDLSPGELGLLQDGSFGQREIAATLVDLTIRGYIDMQRISEKRFLGSYETYRFTLLREDPSMLEMETHEKLILDGLFGVIGKLTMNRIQASVTNPKAREEIKNYYRDRPTPPSLVGMTVESNDIQYKISQIAAEASEKLHAELSMQGYYKKPYFLIGVSSIVGASSALIAGLWLSRFNASLGLLLILTSVTVIPGVIAGIVSVFSSRRATKLGRRAQRYIEGFVSYLRTAELQRYQTLQSPETVQLDGTSVSLYEKYLPYAIAIGLEHDWAVQFPDLKVRQHFEEAALGALVIALGALLIGSSRV